MATGIERISVIGLGYIGLPTAAALAGRGFKVAGVDVRPDIVDTINRGGIHIVEPDLDVVVRGAVATGKLRATTTPEPADVYIIAVPTPHHEGGPDLTYVKAAAKSIAPTLAQGSLVILESTSPVGTTEALSTWLAQARPDLTFPHEHGEASGVRIPYCPERVLPGRVLRELIANDRVIGGLTPKCASRARELYASFVEGELLLTGVREAEMVKLTENAFRDVNIAFANELALVCEKMNVNVWEVINLANHHPRVKILNPGPGVGGHCIAVDPWFIISAAPEQSRLMRTARQINDGRPPHVVEKVLASLEGIANPVVALLGLSFKPDIDDLRHSPAVEVAERLADSASPMRLVVIEPHVSELPGSLKGKPKVTFGSMESLPAADVVVALVKHRAFEGITPETLRGKKVLDFVNLFSRT